MSGNQINMLENIFLTGFMGSGKSHWGSIWSKKMGYSFYDLDAQIELAFGMTIEKIFEKEGEEKFRELERMYLQKFGSKKRFLLACGGGTPCFFDNLEWMKNHGTVIYLKAKPDYILKRVIDETAKRPLMKKLNSAELLFFIETKLKERQVFYNASNFILEVESLTDESLSELLKEKKTNFQ